METFAGAGWRVLAQSRKPPVAALPAQATAILCDATDTEGILAACPAPVDAVIHALSPAYTDAAWQREVMALGDSAIALARAKGALLMLPGNVYNFGKRLPPLLSERTRQVPDTPKAALRIALEQRLQAVAGEGVRSVVIRAGDFIGAEPGTWLDLGVARQLHKGRYTCMGPQGLVHAWAYLPDLAQVFVAVAQQREKLQAFEVFHYGGLCMTGAQLHAALERVTGGTLVRVRFPWWMLRVAAPFSPMMRAVLEMRYLWGRSHCLSQQRLEALLGKVPCTSLDAVLRKVLVAPQYKLPASARAVSSGAEAPTPGHSRTPVPSAPDARGWETPRSR